MLVLQNFLRPQYALLSYTIMASLRGQYKYRGLFLLLCCSIFLHCQYGKLCRSHTSHKGIWNNRVKNDRQKKNWDSCFFIFFLLWRKLVVESVGKFNILYPKLFQIVYISGNVSIVCCIIINHNIELTRTYRTKSNFLSKPKSFEN